MSLKIDPQLEQGMRAHFARFTEACAGSKQRLGYKVAFNAPAIQQALKLPFSLVAGLTRDTLGDAGKGWSVAALARPALEGEVAVWLGKPIRHTATRDEAAAAIERWAPAIELVDFHGGLDQLAGVLEEGVFHRGVVTGQPVATPAGARLQGHQVTIRHADKPLCQVDAFDGTGDAAEVLLHLARLLEGFGQGLQAGDMVILGSMNPLCVTDASAASPKAFEVAIDGIGAVSTILH